MDLITVRKYLQERKIATLQDIAFHFGVDADTIRPLLEVWIKKGKLRRIADISDACRCCSKCDPQKIETYQWKTD